MSRKPSERFFWEQTLGAETLPAFGTTRIDNGTAGTGAHSGTKTMGTLTLEVAGLESSFHDLNRCLCAKITGCHPGSYMLSKRAATILPN